MKPLVALTLALCVGCSTTQREHTGLPLFDYVPEVYIAPGVPSSLCDLDLDVSQKYSGGGYGAYTLNRWDARPSGSSGMTPYDAYAWRLLAITPKGFQVLLIREWGVMNDERDTTAKHTDATLLFFPFGRMTSTNVINSAPFRDFEVSGSYTNRHDSVTAPESRK